MPNLDLKNGQFTQNAFFYNEKYFEVEILKCIKEYVRADIGSHTFFYECEEDLVACFEPTVETFKILKRNVELNELEKKTRLIYVAVAKMMLAK